MCYDHSYNLDPSDHMCFRQEKWRGFLSSIRNRACFLGGLSLYYTREIL